MPSAILQRSILRSQPALRDVAALSPDECRRLCNERRNGLRALGVDHLLKEAAEKRRLNAPRFVRAAAEYEALAAELPKLVGFIASRRAGSSGALRWTLFRTNGRDLPTISNTFAADETRDGVAAILASAGLRLRDDDAVVQA
ncbi:hypothetical protein [Roseomonas xinghualingensis]|uniref:hypothetical protein n=1 Tax=Roseomonas xinghualingensis TaxID=2986475 RepID=UPI0021F1BCEA|nr:hypothetical protein [Roseomonas sp. SXEYE001]MCV4209356.1 hypothetical protein [Roseomonas sp. SXEYE001]